MTAADIRTRLRELAALGDDWSGMGHKKPKLVALLHATLWLLDYMDADGSPPDHIVPGSDGEVLVEWHTPIYRHREFDGTNPDGEYWESNR